MNTYDLDEADRAAPAEQVDATDPSGPTAGWSWWRSRVVAAILLPLSCFLVLLPESFGLTPNRLDPFFYTGYAINFDDIMVAVADDRYFVTRWTAYLPSRLMTEIFGPVWGRLGLRWAVASTILLGLWHLGRQWRWTRPAEVVIGVVIVSTPMFLRAFLTDYVEWIIVGALLLMVMQCLEPRRRWWRPPAIGVLSAVAVIANPFAAVACVGPSAVYLWRTARSVRRATFDVLTAAAGGSAVMLVGLVVFRWRYGIDNVYEPTLEYLSGRSGGPDAWRSPRLEWLLAYSWIYVPAIALAVGWVPQGMRRLVMSTSGGVAASLVLLVQYLGQWLDQFVRDGNGIEISYYWIFVYPALAVYLSLLLGLFRWRWNHAVAFLLGWVTVLLGPRVIDLELPGGWALPLVLVASVTVLVLGARRRPAWSVSALAVTTLVLQVNAPHYDPSEYYDVNSDPRYDEIAFRPRTDSVRAFEEAIWLEERLDTIPDDSDLFFLSDPLYALAIVGIYAPHVTGHVLGLDGDQLSESTRLSVDRGLVSRVALFGPSEFVDSGLAALGDRVDRELLDERHAQGFGYRLVVVELRSPVTGPFSWRPADLQAAIGSVSSDARTADPSVDDAGFLVFGPYVRLADRRYRATIEYRGDSDDDLGAFEVSRNEVTEDGLVDLGAVSAVRLSGTGGRLGSASIEFDGTSTQSWEFRVLWSGARRLTVERISIEPID